MTEKEAQLVAEWVWMKLEKPSNEPWGRVADGFEYRPYTIDDCAKDIKEAADRA